MLFNSLDFLCPTLWFHPIQVVYEVCPGVFTNDGVESSLDVIANHKLSWSDIHMAIEINHLKTYNTLLNDVNRELFGMNKNFNEPLSTEEGAYISRGYVENKKFDELGDEKLLGTRYLIRDD